MNSQKTTLIPAIVVSNKTRDSNKSKLNLDKIFHSKKTTATEPLQVAVINKNFQNNEDPNSAALSSVRFYQKELPF